MAAKMFALFALLALCASATTATHVPWHLSPVAALGAMNPCMQYCMTQQPFAVNPCMQYCTMQQAFAVGRFASHLSPVATLGAMNPCMQYCMTQQPFAMNPCMQYCTMQQAFAVGRFASPASMMLQQPWTSQLQSYWSPRMMPFQQSQCGSISQIMQQQPFMFNPMATAIPPMFFQQPFAGVPF